MNTYVLIALGSALGGMGRHWIGGAIASRAGDALPWGTLGVNISGSFLIGLIAVLLEVNERSGAAAARAFLIVGVLGGYTTFSAFSLQTLNLLREGKVGYAAANVALSVALCLIAVWVGYGLARVLRTTMS